MSLSISARVTIVDDDEAVRLSLKLLMQSMGFDATCYGNPLDFMKACELEPPGCLLLDVRMPGMSGLELQQRLQQRGISCPVIMLTGHADVAMAVQAMKHGAFDFLEKPVNEQQLLDRVSQAIQLNDENRRKLEEQERRQQRLERLTRRESEVMHLIVGGKANKHIAQELGISERTVELHRAHVLHKLEVRSVAQLVQLVLEGETGRMAPD